MNSKDPQLSVVVVIVSDTTDARCDLSLLSGNLAALHSQVDPPRMEILVPYEPTGQSMEELQQQYPDVIFKPVTDLATHSRAGGSREHHDELRARGIAESRGEIVALLEDHGYPDRNWARNIWTEHQREHAAVGGAMENGVDRPLNWAVYFCDFFRYQNPVPEGDSFSATDANISYKRSILDALRPLLRSHFRETVINQALLERGAKIFLSRSIVVYQKRKNLRLRSALKERFIWGRSYAAGRSQSIGSKRFVLGAFSPILPLLIVARIAKTVLSRRRLVTPFLKSAPLVFLLAVFWSLGELVGYLTGRPAIQGYTSEAVANI